MVPTFHYSITNTILDINDWNRISVNIKKKKKSSLEQNLSLHNQTYTWYYQSKYLKKEEKKNLNALKNDKTIKTSRHLVLPFIWRGGLGILNMNT